MANNNNPIIHHLHNRQSGFCLSSDFQSKLFRDRLSIAKNLYKRDLVSHFGCVNAIEFSQTGQFLTSGELIDQRIKLSVRLSINYAKLFFSRFIPSVHCIV